MKASLPFVGRRPLPKLRCGIVPLLLSIGTIAGAQQSQVTIQVLQGRSGKPVPNARVIVFIGDTPEHLYVHQSSIEAHTDRLGLAVISIGSAGKWMQPWVDYKHQCSDDPNDLKIEVGTINAVGIRAANSCGNSKSPIVPGRLTVFVRAMTLKEKMDL